MAVVRTMSFARRPPCQQAPLLFARCRALPLLTRLAHDLIAHQPTQSRLPDEAVVAPAARRRRPPRGVVGTTRNHLRANLSGHAFLGLLPGPPRIRDQIGQLIIRFENYGVDLEHMTAALRHVGIGRGQQPVCDEPADRTVDRRD